MLKKYQPGRNDLLINTDWGISHDALTAEEARNRSLLLFHDRWVTAEEKKQIKDEYLAYRSIRITGILLLFVGVLLVLNFNVIYANGLIPALIAVVYAGVALAGGAGLMNYVSSGRYFAFLVFISFFVLPFTPQFADDKGAPLLIPLGVIGLYCLLRKTARKILWPQTGSAAGDKKINPVVRIIIYAIVLLIGLLAGYFVYDLSQAKRMAAAACLDAKPGMPLEEFLLKFSEGDYKIIRNSDYVLLVPGRGMGRNHCAVFHDGRKITNAKTGFAD